MRIVLRKLADAHQSHQRTGSLIAVDHAELGHAQRQVAVRLNALFVNQQAARTVHRLDAELFFVFGLARVVVRAVFVPMAGNLPQNAVHNTRCGNFDIAVMLLAIAHILNQLAVNLVAFVVPENRARRIFRLKVEQIHLAAEFAMVAFFGFFQHFQISLEVFFVRPGRCINTLQHFLGRVAAPVCACDFHQFEGVTDFAGGGYVRPAAEIRKCSLTIQRNRFVFRQVFNNFGLIMLTHVFEVFDGLVTRHDDTFELFVAFDDFMHFSFDFFKVFGRKRFFARKVVIKAVFNGRADGNLNVGPQLLDRLRHDMRAGMAQDVKAFLILTGDNGHGCVGSDGSA